MSDFRLHIADVDFAGDSETREAQHELLASFLGAYADGELPPETQSQIEAHLVGCARCRKELGMHRVIRERLGNEPVPAATAILRERIAHGVKSAPVPVLGNIEDGRATPTTNSGAVRFINSWTALALVAVALFAAAYAANIGSLRTRSTRLTPGTVAATSSVALFASVLEDYRRVTAGDLPGRARDLVAVRAAVPFAFTPLSNPALRLVAAWTTSLSGEPAAVLAYRFNDRVVLQYFVTESLLFQSQTVRAALARKQAVSVNDGTQGMLVWAEPEYGSVLVGDLQPAEFDVLRTADERH